MYNNKIMFDSVKKMMFGFILFSLFFFIASEVHADETETIAQTIATDMTEMTPDPIDVGMENITDENSENVTNLVTETVPEQSQLDDESYTEESNVEISRKMDLLKQFPFESIVGYSWKTYSEKPLSDIFLEYSNKLGALYSAKLNSNETPRYSMIAGGFFVSPDGQFLTTYRQIKDIFNENNVSVSSQLSLKLQTKQSLELMDITLIKVDVDADLVLLKADVSRIHQTEIPYVQLDSTVDYQVGQAVFGISLPSTMAVDGGLYPGFLTEIGAQEMKESGFVSTQLKSSAIIPNTSSGSIITDTTGAVVGISTVPELRNLSDRYSVFYPIDQVKSRMGYLLSEEVEETPSIGVTFISDLDNQRLRSTFLLPEGLYITKVESSSPAYVADIRKDDIILSINGLDVHSTYEYQEFISNLVPGESIQLTVFRPSLNRQYEKTIYLD